MPAFLFLLFLGQPLVLPGFGHAAAKEEEFTVRRAFSGLVRRDMAERALRIAAEAEAMDRAVLLLGKEKAFASRAPSSGPGPSQPGGEQFFPADFPLAGLARAVFGTKLLSVELEGFPPSVQVVARVELGKPDDMASALREALSRRGLVEVYGRVLAARRKLLRSYDALAEPLLPLNPSSDGGMGKAHALRRVCHEMDALEILVRFLPGQDPQWKEPEKVRRELLKAKALAPENALVLTALAEVLLQLDRPVAALEEVGSALRHDSGYARAHDVRGAALLRQRLPGLAAESFGKAIALSPSNSGYLVHRASAYLVLGDEKGMCEDFVSACGLGDCDGLHWARSAGKCEATGYER